MRCTGMQRHCEIMETNCPGGGGATEPVARSEAGGLQEKCQRVPGLQGGLWQAPEEARGGPRPRLQGAQLPVQQVQPL